MPHDDGPETEPEVVRSKLEQLALDAAAEPVPAPIRKLAEQLQAALDARKAKPSLED